MSTTVNIDKIPAVGIVKPAGWREPKEFEYVPEPLEASDVDIQIIACGLCGSDLHTVKGNWGDQILPLAVGHEIIGHVVNKGPDVKGIEIGDRVGVGAQCKRCQHCNSCAAGKDNNCSEPRWTYATPLPNGKVSQGGYAKYIRVSSEFAFKIPDNLKTEHVAPMMCGGITGLKPLLTAGVTKGTKVGIVGIGGIGHMTIMFAKALGAEVTAISRGTSKKDIAFKLGADHFIATSDAADFPSKHVDSLDVIVNTANTFSGESLVDILSLLKAEGKFMFITAPPATELLTLSPFTLIQKNLSIAGSVLGTIADIKYMLKLASEHDIKPWVEEIDISEKNVATAWDRLDKGDVRFRFVFVGYDKLFGK